MPDLEQDGAQEANVETKVEVSPAEQEAREGGWVPKEEYNGDEHKWVDAPEFVRRGELFKKIDTQNKEIKEIKKVIQLQAQHNAKLKETEYQRALAYLKTQKKEALTEGDADKLIDIDERISVVKEQQKTFQAQEIQKVAEQVEEIHPEFEAWTRKNTWYDTSKPMKAFADELGKELAMKGMAPGEVLKEVEKQVKEEFPKRFTNPNRDKPGSVEGASTKGASTGSGSYAPSEIERQVAKKFVKSGVFKTEAEYYKQLESMK